MNAAGDDPRVDVSARCPVCGAGCSMNFRSSYLVDAFKNDTPIQFFAACHHRFWTATQNERERVRDYFTKDWRPRQR